MMRFNDTIVKVFPLNNRGNNNERKKADTAIIFSQIRSGSSFFFNTRRNVSFFFEPVWDLTPEHQSDAVTVIEELSNCRFDKLGSIYRKSLNGSFSTI